MGIIETEHLMEYLTKYGDKFSPKEAEDFLKAFGTGDNKIDIESKLDLSKCCRKSSFLIRTFSFKRFHSQDVSDAEGT